MKSYAEYLTRLSDQSGWGLAGHDVELLAGALLDGGVPDVELGALVASLRTCAEQDLLIDGLLAALDTRICRWSLEAERAVPIVIGCYGGVADRPNLAPLLALLLARFGIPVLLHGPLHAESGASVAPVLRALGIMPCTQQQQVARELVEKRIAFCPDALLSPGLAALRALRVRIGPVPLLTTVARLLDPFDLGGLVLAAGESAAEVTRMRSAVVAKGGRALLLQSSDGDAFGSPQRRPRIEYLIEGAVQVLFEEDAQPSRRALSIPHAADAVAAAAWIQQACDGTRAVPAPIVNQFAACLYAVGYCEDFNQAKALAAIAAAGRNVA